MASVIHIAEVAAILAVAYVLGWVVGYFAHRLLARKPGVVADVAAERIAAVTAPGAAEDALVKAPVIEPVATTPAAEPPPPEPEPASIVPTVVAAEPEPVAAQPEVRAAPMSDETAPILPPVEIPVVSVPPMQVEPLTRSKPPADPEPPPPPEPEVVLTATPAARPGEAWSGEVRGRTAAAAAVIAAPEEEPAPVIIEPPPAELPLTIDLGELGPGSTYGEPMMPAPVPPPPAPARPLDEDAAMRAIEGGWSRVKTRAMSDAPELSDVGAAVAAAQSAVEQVLAQAGIEAETTRQSARPKGLPRPRNGKRDDLKQINGLGALDESTLNNLGVYHFDQIAGWTDQQVLWMENHVFARGRIGHENWQQQARDLAPATGS